jgi:hypothetical protein
MRPSSLPILAQCPKFESGEARDYTDEGTRRHEALAKALRNKDTNLDDTLEIYGFDTESVEGITWAFEYVKVNLPMEYEQLHVERPISLITDDFNKIMDGTVDVGCGNHILDFKWRERNYREQLIAYSLGWMQEQGIDEVHCHILYMQPQKAVTFTINRDEAWEVVNEIEAKVNDPEAKENPCEYCGWCAKAKECPALNSLAMDVVDGREDWSLENYHSSQIDNPIEMSKALLVARHVSKWCDAVEHHAKKMAIDNDVHIPGFKVQARKGRRIISDIGGAFNASRMDQDEFLDCCVVSFTNLVEKHRLKEGISKAAATKEMERFLESVMDRSATTYSLVKERTK